MFPDSTALNADECPAPGDGPADADAALMMRAAGGCEESFAALVRKYQQPLVNFFYRMGATSDCEDHVQETFLRLYRWGPRYRATASFQAFLYHLARNVWADAGRKKGRVRRLLDAFRDERETEVQPPPTAGIPDLSHLLGQLSPKLREVVVLQVLQGLRHQEIADVLEIPVGTVKSRISLAMAALKELCHES